MTTPRTLEYLPLDELVPAPVNPKRHRIDLVDESMARHGYIEPVVLDERSSRLISGHGRLESLTARRDDGEPPPEGIIVDDQGRWLVPVVRGWASASDLDAGAALVSVNRTTELGGWDTPELGIVLGPLAEVDGGLAGVGYTAEEVAELLAAPIHVAEHDRAPAEPRQPDEVQQRVQPGDVWQLGPHRVKCGDSRNPGDVAHLLAGATVNLAFTSPPYADRRKYDETSGFRPIPPDEYVAWFAPVAANVAEHLADDGSWFVNIKAGADGLDTDLYVLDLVIAHVREWGWHYATEFCWERPGVPGRVWRRFKNEYEPIYQFARADWKMRADAVRHESTSVPTYNPDDPWSMERTQGGTQGATSFKDRGQVEEGWAYPGNRLPSFSGTHEATGHSAAFPVGLPAWFVRAYTDEGDAVYDPFLGSGSTLLAADQHDRIGYGMELSPGYCDVILDRWERHGGQPPTLMDRT